MISNLSLLNPQERSFYAGGGGDQGKITTFHFSTAIKKFNKGE
jgi:hypothetical protein